MITPSPVRTAMMRWLRFNFVGLFGVAVQFLVLACLTRLGVPYLVATACAVESAVVHNFLWHERYTWTDRSLPGGYHRLCRLLGFNLSNGGVSLIGNLLMMRWLVGHLGLPVLPSSGLAILTCSAVNFLLGEHFVFRKPRQP